VDEEDPGSLLCNDDNPCTIDVCDREAGVCLFDPTDACCLDASHCGFGEGCVNSACQPVLCRACEDDRDCPAPGARCYQPSDRESFCIVPCGERDSCPEDFRCHATSDGIARCVPTTGTCGPGQEEKPVYPWYTSNSGFPTGSGEGSGCVAGGRSGGAQVPFLMLILGAVLVMLRNRKHTAARGQPDTGN
jgi:hypothetical protein